MLNDFGYYNKLRYCAAYTMIHIFVESVPVTVLEFCCVVNKDDFIIY